MHSIQRLKELLNKHLDSSLSYEEKDELNQYILNKEYETFIEEHILQTLKEYPLHEENQLSAKQSEEILQNIFSTPELSKVRSIWSSKYLKSGVAAAVIIGICWFASQIFFNDIIVIPENIIVENKTIIHKNLSDSTETIQLSDGSIVSLYPQSSLQYLSKFESNTRDVTLNGNAFFEVAPNPNQPFIVHTKNITTKVLGTSFLISVDPTTGKEEVSVKTGKVEVSENPVASHQEIAVVVLLPNQKAVFESENRSLKATIVEKPTMILPEENISSQRAPLFVYEEVKISKVLADLELAYGIKISLNNPALGNCLFTGDISENDLFTQLKILCLSTGSSYEIDGTDVLLKGRGC